jgi:hypothetical protein
MALAVMIKGAGAFSLDGVISVRMDGETGSAG